MMAGCVLFTDDCTYMLPLYLACMLNDRLLLGQWYLGQVSKIVMDIICYYYWCSCSENIMVKVVSLPPSLSLSPLSPSYPWPSLYHLALPYSLSPFSNSIFLPAFLSLCFLFFPFSFSPSIPIFPLSLSPSFPLTSLLVLIPYGPPPTTSLIPSLSFTQNFRYSFL